MLWWKTRFWLIVNVNLTGSNIQFVSESVLINFLHGWDFDEYLDQLQLGRRVSKLPFSCHSFGDCDLPLTLCAFSRAVPLTLCAFSRAFENVVWESNLSRLCWQCLPHTYSLRWQYQARAVIAYASYSLDILSLDLQLLCYPIDYSIIQAFASRIQRWNAWSLLSSISHGGRGILTFNV